MKFEEIARTVASRLRKAAANDVIAENFSADEAIGSSAWTEFESIREYLSTFTVGGRPISTAEIHRILRMAGTQLQLDDPDLLTTIDESFSSSSYFQLVASISALIAQVKKK